MTNDQIRLIKETTNPFRSKRQTYTQLDHSEIPLEGGPEPDLSMYSRRLGPLDVVPKRRNPFKKPKASKPNWKPKPKTQRQTYVPPSGKKFVGLAVLPPAPSYAKWLPPWIEPDGSNVSTWPTATADCVTLWPSRPPDDLESEPEKIAEIKFRDEGLRGSPKQIAWAISIRRDMIAHAKSLGLVKVAETLRRITDATWFISNRNDPPDAWDEPREDQMA